MHATAKVLLLSLSASLTNAQVQNTPKEGDPAPNFSVVTDQGKRITNKSLGGKMLVLNFWHTSCRPCVKELPSLTAFARAFRRQGVVVLAVSGDEDAVRYRRFLRERQVNLRTFRDPTLQISKSYGTVQFPETFLIQEDRIILKVVGGKDWMGDEIVPFVRAHLRKRQPTREQLKSADTNEGERKAYDEIYSAKRDMFNAAPNAFMMRVIAGRTPGRALDVAMGQGRNALWLASQGWTVSGFDISPLGIDEARKEAARRGLHIETFVTPYEQFDWGKDKWDLIVFSYFFPPAALPKIWDSLTPGALILVEGFHIDTAKVRPVGGGYHDNELFRVLKDYRIPVYEDVQDRQEWGLPYGATNRLVRVFAQKGTPLPPGCSWEGRSYSEKESMCWGVGRWECGAEGWAPAGRCAQ